MWEVLLELNSDVEVREEVGGEFHLLEMSFFRKHTCHKCFPVAHEAETFIVACEVGVRVVVELLDDILKGSRAVELGD